MLMERARLDVEQLAAFDRIVREGGFGRAAVALGLGQPAVSARIRALEAQVGGALFTRGRRVQLTALGETFLPFARRALEVLAEGVEAARLAQTGERGRLRLGALASLAGGLVGPALAAVLRERPGLDCTVKGGDHELVVSLLLDGLVELGLTVWPCSEAAAADLQPLLLLREPVVLVVAPGHPLAGRGPVTSAEVARLARPLYRLRWWQRHEPRLEALAARSGASVELTMEAGRALTLAGVGCGFFVRTYLAAELAAGALLEVPVSDLKAVVRGTALVRRRVGPLSPAAAALVEALRREALRQGILAPGAAAGRPPRRARRARRTVLHRRA
jgi:DNA-binding transcriptional LysR family regulator